MKSNFLNINTPYWLVFFIIIKPIGEITIFFINVVLKQEISIGAYISLFCFILFNLSLLKERKYFVFFISAFFLYNIFIPETNFINNGVQTLPLLIMILFINYLPNVRVKFSPKQNNFISYFAILYLFAYFISVSFVGEVERGGRAYFDGFVIAHGFAYNTIVFSVFFFSTKKPNMSILFLGASLLSGTRSGIFLVVLTVGYYVILLSSQKIKISKIYYLLIPVLILLLFPQIFQNKQFATMIDTFSKTDIRQVSLLGGDEQSKSFTAIRSVIWYNSLTEYINKFNLLEKFLGGGAMSPFLFNQTFGFGKIWLHNDFFNIIFAFGLIGLLAYLFALIKFYFLTKNIYFILFIVVAAFTNGFYYYDSMLIMGLFYLSIQKSDI